MTPPTPNKAAALGKAINATPEAFCPPSANKAVRITPGAIIPMPCWLWRPVAARWWHNEGTIRVNAYDTHWHPDQPEAPTFAPEEEKHLSIAPHRLDGHAGPGHAPAVPAVEGVRSVIERVIGTANMRDRMTVDRLVSALTPYLASADLSTARAELKDRPTP